MKEIFHFLLLIVWLNSFFQRKGRHVLSCNLSVQGKSSRTFSVVIGINTVWALKFSVPEKRLGKSGAGGDS